MCIRDRLSPVGAYYPNGIEPVKIFVEQKYVRAVIGGTGFTKAGANYAISLKGCLLYTSRCV